MIIFISLIIAGFSDGLRYSDSQRVAHTCCSCFSPPTFPPGHSCSVPPTSPPMATTTGGSWTCGECGRVCKSRNGLTRHSYTHKKLSRVGEVSDNRYRIYHATLDGIPIFFLPVPTIPNHFQGSRVLQPVHFFHQERHPPLSLTIRVTTGLLLHHALASSWPRSSTLRRTSQIIPSTNSSTSGQPHWSLMTTLPPSPTTEISTQHSMQSNLTMYHGNHTLHASMVSAQTMGLSPSG